MRITLAVACAIAVATQSAVAQLRPLDPVDFSGFTGGTVHIDAGLAVYDDQRASLAGVTGRLWEIGNVRVMIRTGRVILEFGGTVQRLFNEDTVWAAPFGDATPSSADGERHDAGDYRAATIVRLTRTGSATPLALRFGARLPTTDNRVGLDRDATDFFATLAARRAFARLSLAAEAGVSINGTRQSTYEQSDVFVYALTGELRAAAALTAFAVVLGQEDLHSRPAVRGNEDLGELRLGVRVGERRWVKLTWVHGYREFSPGNGWQLAVGAVLH